MAELSLDDVLNIIEDTHPNEETCSEPRPSNRATVRQRFGAGLRPGLLRHAKQKRTRKQRLKKKQSLVDQQANEYNASGRARGADHAFPASANDFERKTEKGKGKWKRWTAPAVLRAGFSPESATSRQIASSIEGGGPKHAGRCRFVTASAILEGQNRGMALVQQTGSQGSLDFWIRSLMFDESTFSLSLQHEAAAATSVSCSHGHWTYGSSGDVTEEHIFRPPQALFPNMNASTMWSALSSGPGGFNSICPARFQCTLTTCDAHAANVRLLRFLDQSLPQECLFLPVLCVQHRTGNVIEQLSKLTGVLGGNFSVAKALNKSNLLKGLKRQVTRYISEELSILDSTPAAVLDEWKQAQTHAAQLVELCLCFDEDTVSHRAEQNPPGIAVDAASGRAVQSANSKRVVQKRGVRWGAFLLSPIVPQGGQTGWGAICGLHHNRGDGSGSRCKKALSMGRLSHSACILRLKRWLLAGLNDAELSVQNARSDHVAMGGPGLQAFAEGPSEEEMDEKIRQYTASSL